MSVNFDLFSLPMHAGEKLDAAILYSPSVSCAYDEGIDDDGYNAKVAKEKLPRTISCFGVGWQLKLPYVENPGKRNISNTYVRLENGAVYLADSSEDNGLADYELSDVTYIAAPSPITAVLLIGSIPRDFPNLKQTVLEIKFPTTGKRAVNTI